MIFSSSFDPTYKSALFIITQLLGPDVWERCMFISTMWNTVSEEGRANCERLWAHEWPARLRKELIDPETKRCYLPCEDAKFPVCKFMYGDSTSLLPLYRFACHWGQQEAYTPQVSTEIDQIAHEFNISVEEALSRTAEMKAIQKRMDDIAEERKKEVAKFEAELEKLKKERDQLLGEERKRMDDLIKILHSQTPSPPPPPVIIDGGSGGCLIL